MNYITAEQFLSLPEEVQKIFIDWWKPKLGDLYNDIDNGFEEDIYIIESKEKVQLMKEWKNCINTAIRPIFRLDQLWEFIEDITEDKVYVTNCPHQFRGVGLDEIGWNFSNTNLLQAMWDLAIKVAREWLKDE